MYIGMKVIFYTSTILYIKTVTLKKYASGKMANFQSDLFFKATWRLFFKEHAEDENSQFYFLYY